MDPKCVLALKADVLNITVFAKLTSRNKLQQHSINP